MNYSLLDAFMLWLGPLVITCLIVGFIATLLIACTLIDKLLLRKDADRKDLESWDVPDGIEITGKEVGPKLSQEARERHDAYWKEVRRLEAIRHRCLACTKRTRYSRSTLRKTR